MIIYLFAFLVLLSIFYGPFIVEKWKGVRRRRPMTAHIPGDEGIVFFGNFLEMGHDAESSPRILLKRAKAAREKFDGELLKIWVFCETVFAPFTGNMLQHILESKSEINKGLNYQFFVQWLGRGLLLEGGEEWLPRRRLLNPSFHFSMLLGYIDKMNSHAKVLTNILENHCGKEFDIYPFMKRFTLDVICDTAMGKDLDSLHQPDQPYVKAISQLMFLGVKGAMQPHLWTFIGRWLTGWTWKHDRNVRIAHEFTIGVIKERIELLSHGEVEPNKKAFLDLLIVEKERSNLSMDDIRKEVDTFMFAGHDTTSSALGWTLWCLAHHQDIQQLAYQEVNMIFGEDMDRCCTKDDIARLAYLERCIKESMRLFPPVPFIGRNLHEDLQMGPYLLPRDSHLVISPYLVHRNERIYPIPEIYDPDRFLPENSASRHPYDYIPFSAGLRNCIGQKFAMQQLKIVLSWLLRRFRFTSERDFNSVKILTEVVLKSKEGINVIIESR